MEPDTHYKTDRPVALLISSILVWGLHFLPFLMPDARLWGFNHLLFGPPALIYIYIASGILSFLLLFFGSNEKLAGAFGSIAGILLDRHFAWKWLLFAAAAPFIFWWARMPVNLLGDGYTLIYSLASDKPIIFKWSEVGAIKVVFYVSRLLPYSGTTLGKYSYALVSVISGGVTIGFLGGLAYELGRDNATRLFALCLLLFSGWILLFFGYVEHYPVLWMFTIGYLFFAIRYLQGRGNLVPSTLLLLASLALHLQTLFFLFSYVGLIFARGPGAKFYQKYKAAFWKGAIILAIIGGVTFLWRYNQSSAFQLFFVPLFSRPAAPNYSLFSPDHMLDMLNELILLMPLAPVLLVIAWRRIRILAFDNLDWFLVLFSFGGIGLLFVIDPKLGMGRDWDLFALSGLGPALFLIKQSIASSKVVKRLFPGLCLLALVIVLPFYVINLHYQPSIDYFTWLLKLDQPRSRSGLALLRQFYTDVGAHSKADAVHHEICRRFPIVLIGKRIEILTADGQYTEALALADSVFRVDPYSVESYNLRGWVFLSMGEYAKAVEDLEQSLSLKQYDHRIFCNLAMAYSKLGQYEPMMKNYRRAYELYPNYLPALDGLAVGHYILQQYDSAMTYARQALEKDSMYVTGYEVLGMASFQKGKYSDAEKFLSRFVRITNDDIRKSRAINVLAELKKRR
jgi:tetratricopeptide (TPR) repeat protein